ncbi:MAG: hypothetical protein FJW80_01905 [Actinobacteria bacterium]|nr:hypothetical protein [Actinomycetota bacterium]
MWPRSTVSRCPALIVIGTFAIAGSSLWCSGEALKMSHPWFSCPSKDDTVPHVEEDPSGGGAQVQMTGSAAGLTYNP